MHNNQTAVQQCRQNTLWRNNHL